jgi:hypothetical protein
VAKSWVLVQGSGVFGFGFVSTGATCANPSVAGKKRIATARVKFAAFFT